LGAKAPTRKFSSTLMSGKIMRPSGTSTMPCSTRWLLRNAPISAPSKRMTPARATIRPAIVLSNVVLPAPLLPRSAVIEPGATSRETPCSTSTSP